MCLTICPLGWSDDFKKGRYQKAWGLKNSYLVPRYHIGTKNLRNPWTLDPENFKYTVFELCRIVFYTINHVNKISIDEKTHFDAKICLSAQRGTK
jgi:hypothetical protein